MTVPTWHVYANSASGPASNASKPTFLLYRPLSVLSFVLVLGNPIPLEDMAEGNDGRSLNWTLIFALGLAGSCEADLAIGTAVAEVCGDEIDARREGRRDMLNGD